MDTKNFEKKMETISPFELKNQLIDMADESLKKTARTMLNAGRGNPNWIATTPREAFFLLGQFGLEECRRVMNLPEGIAGIPQKEGIASRFEAFLKKNNAAHGTKLLEQTYNYLLMPPTPTPWYMNGQKPSSATSILCPTASCTSPKYWCKIICRKKCAITALHAAHSTSLPPKAEPPPCVTSSIPSRRTSCWIKVTVSP